MAKAMISRVLPRAPPAVDARCFVLPSQTFGFYQPPPQVLPLPTQELGLHLLNTPSLSDFEIVCNDGVRLPCSRRLLEARWPWFRNRMALYESKFSRPSDGDSATSEMTPVTTACINASGQAHRPTELYLPTKGGVGQAFLQYFYTLNLITPHQLAVHILVGLLVLAQRYEIEHLRSLVVHALHVHLSNGQGSPAAIYEAATLGRALALQTRALKLMMNVSERLPGGFRDYRERLMTGHPRLAISTMPQLSLLAASPGRGLLTSTPRGGLCLPVLDWRTHRVSHTS